MNRKLTNTMLSPKQAIIIYSDKGSAVNYLEKVEIISVDKGYTFGAAAPVTDDFLKNIAEAYAKDNNLEMGFDSIIPDHILFTTKTLGKVAVIWYRPAESRTLNLNHTTAGKGSFLVKVPAVLYVMLNTSLYLYALRDNKRPTLASKLYNAPFFNVYTDGRVCLGTARVGKRTKYYETEAERFERGFWLAEQNGGDVEGRTKTPLSTLWKRLTKSKTAFPVTELTPHKKFKTLNDIIKDLIKS